MAVVTLLLLGCGKAEPKMPATSTKIAATDTSTTTGASTTTAAATTTDAAQQTAESDFAVTASTNLGNPDLKTAVSSSYGIAIAIAKIVSGSGS